MGRKQGLRGGCGIAVAVMALAGAPPARAQAADPDRGYATQGFTPKGFRLPEGEGCGGEVARWKAVQDNDYASGNIGLKVYHQIEGEIARAQAACQAGQDAQARAMVRDSKRRHGYPG